jgi:excisionase family DNA binding protein
LIGGEFVAIKVYTPEEAAQILKLSTRTIREYLRTGKITGAKIGKEWRITEEQIRKFLDRHTQERER